MSLRPSNDIRAELSELKNDLKAMAELDSASLEELKELDAKAEELSAELDRSVEFEAIRARVIADAEASAEASSQPSVVAEAIQPQIEEEKEMKLPAVVASSRTRHFASAEDAFVSGQAIRAMAGNRQAQSFMNDLATDGSNGEDNTIPAPLSNALINLMEDYGVARQRCRRIVMSQNTWDVPKLNGHVSINYTGEAQAISSSDLSFGQVNLVAKKMTALTKLSSEVTEDSIISMMDTVVESMAYQMAIAEDTNLFIGVPGGLLEDSAAGSLQGHTDIADTNVASVSALALSDFTAASVSVGNPVIGARNEWYINPTLFHGPVRDLLLAAGGNTQSVIEGGQRPSLLGYPVNFVNVLPGAAASGAGDLLAVFGDVSLACYFGERRGLNFRTLNELYANTDQVGVQCTQRVALKVANPEVLAKITITG